MNKSGSTALLVGATIVAWGGYAGYQRWEKTRLPDSPVAAESADEKAQSVQAAFAAAAAVQDTEVETFVAALQAAVVEGDAEAVASMVSPSRTVDAVVAGSGQNFPGAARTMLEAQLSGELIEFFDATVVQTDVKRIDRDSEGNIVVYLRMIDHDRILMKSRWWLHHDGDALRWWDAEDLQLGLRVTTMMAAGVSSAAASGDTGKLERFIEVVSRMAEMSFENADEVRALAADLDALDTAGLPASFRHLAIIARATASTVLDEPEDALRRLDELEQQSLQALDMPVRHFQRSIACLALERWDEAAAAAELYLELLGDDAETFDLLGTAELRRGNMEAALGAFAKGIDDDPLLPDNYVGIVAATYDEAVVVEYLRKAPGHEVLDGAAQDLVDAVDGDGLLTLLDAAAVAWPDWDASAWRAHAEALDGE